jgi:hypothetical protein
MTVCNDLTGWDRREAIAVGCTVYEALRTDERPAWAGRLLRLCLELVPDPPPEVVRVAELTEDPERWREAHQAFSAVRRRSLHTRAGTQRHILLHFAENVAKVTCNAAGEPAPFDHNAGWYLLMHVRDFLASADPDADLQERIRRAVMHAG